MSAAHEQGERRLHVYEIDDGEQWWIVATSEAAALEAAKQYEIPAVNDPTDPFYEPVTCEQVPDDKILLVGADDADAWEGAPPEAIIRATDNAASMSARAWAEWCGDGAMIGGTVW